MWRLLSRPLEIVARARIGISAFFRTKVRVGDPGAVDALGSLEWRRYTSSKRLFDVWGPLPDSPWEPFHCVPLFAALDRIGRNDVGPTPPAAPGAGAPRPGGTVLPDHVRPGSPPPGWISPETWTFLDLPGPAAVEVGTWLVTAAACQPVCTFDNWPHRNGILRPEHVLAELLRWASTVAEARPRLETASPPLWICDSDRLGRPPGTPGQFDNRYYLDDSILPGPTFLKEAGVRRVVYATVSRPRIPVIDLEAYFQDLLAAGIPIFHAELMDPALEPTPYVAPTTPRPPPRSGFRRSSAGGFGTEVPKPSSGTGGGGGG